MKFMIASGRPSLLGLNAKSFQKVAVYEKVAFSISKADNVVFPILDLSNSTWLTCETHSESRIKGKYLIGLESDLALIGNVSTTGHLYNSEVLVILIRIVS